MFEHLDFMVSEEHRRDIVSQAATARLIRSLEIPDRRKKDRRIPGLRLIGALKSLGRLADRVASVIANSHHTPHRRTHTL